MDNAQHSLGLGPMEVVQQEACLHHQPRRESCCWDPRKSHYQKILQFCQDVDASVSTFLESMRRYLTGPQPCGKTVHNHTANIRLSHSSSPLLASPLPAIISMSAFSLLIPIDWSKQYVHCQLSLFGITELVSPCCDDPKTATQNVVNDISGYEALENKLLAVNACSTMVATQSCPWNSPIVRITAIAGAGRSPMVPSF